MTRDKNCEGRDSAINEHALRDVDVFKVYYSSYAKQEQIQPSRYVREI